MYLPLSRERAHERGSDEDMCLSCGQEGGVKRQRAQTYVMRKAIKKKYAHNKKRTGGEAQKRQASQTQENGWWRRIVTELFLLFVDDVLRSCGCDRLDIAKTRFVVWTCP